MALPVISAGLQNKLLAVGRSSSNAVSALSQFDLYVCSYGILSLNCFSVLVKVLAVFTLTMDFCQIEFAMLSFSSFSSASSENRSILFAVMD